MMTDNKEKLDRLCRQIEESAQKDADRIIADAKKQADEMIAKETARLEKSLGSAILEKTAAFEAAERRRLAEKRYAADRRVLLHRNALVDKLFGEITAELSAFTASDGYAGYLKKCVQTAQETESFTSDVIAYVRPDDIKTAKAALGDLKIDIQPDRRIEIGGLIIKYPDKGRYIDLTLDTALENERNTFSAKSEMQLS